MIPTRSNGIPNARLPLRPRLLLGVGLLSVGLLSVGPTGGLPLWGQEPGEAPGSPGAKSPAVAGDRDERSAQVRPSPRTPSNGRSGQVLIVCGLPGDDEHAVAFEAIRLRWIGWLTGAAGFSPQQVTVLSGVGPPVEPGAGKVEPGAGKVEPGAGKVEPGAGKVEPGAGKVEPGAEKGRADLPRVLPATRQQLQQTAGELVERLGAEERLWVLLLGHANHDGEHAYFHLPGPDVDERMLGLLFDKVSCSEQVFWVTNSCAGWFVDRLSKPGRIVIAATAADSEYNETEFPAALAQAMERPASELDRDGDGWVAVAELFAATVAEVTAIFAADERAATEHAQLDDNGDRRGTELPDLAGPKPPAAEPAEQPAENSATENSAAEPLSGTNPLSSAAAEAQRPDDGVLAASTHLYEVESPKDESTEGKPPEGKPPVDTTTPDRPTAEPRPREQP